MLPAVRARTNPIRLTVASREGGAARTVTAAERSDEVARLGGEVVLSIEEKGSGARNAPCCRYLLMADSMTPTTSATVMEKTPALPASNALRHSR